jgi:hypothetical protein
VTTADEWLARQRAIVLRLPRWLVGSALLASVALGIEWALATSGPAPVLVHVIGGSPRGDTVAALGTVTAPVVVCMIALYAIARIVRPRPATNLPNARVE